MRNLRRNKKKLYLCQIYEKNGLNLFKEPIPLYEDYQPTNSSGDLISIGMSYPLFLRIKTNISEKDIFHPNDRLYIYKDIPKTHDPLCKDADYEVYKQPLFYINEGDIMLKRLSSDWDEN